MVSPGGNALHSRAKVADYFFFLRPMLHPPVWTIVILGYFRIAESYSARLGWLLMVSSACASWAYIVNQISDIESDRINRKLFFLPEKIIRPGTARVMATVALLIAFIGGFALGIKIGLLFTVGLSMGYAYSARPFGWKARPIAGFLANAVAHGILMFMVGYLVGGGEPWTGLLYSTPYFFAVGAAFIGTTIPDYEGDRKTGKITPAVSLGPKSASAFMAICADSAVIAAFLVDDMPMFLAASISLPFYHYYWQKGKYGGNPIVAVKISILALTLAAAWRFWPYLAGFMLLILVTRIYYLKRFHIIYPKLT